MEQEDLTPELMNEYCDRLFKLMEKNGHATFKFNIQPVRMPFGILFWRITKNYLDGRTTAVGERLTGNEACEYLTGFAEGYVLSTGHELDLS